MATAQLSASNTRAFSNFLRQRPKQENHPETLRKKLLEYILDGLKKEHVKTISKETLIKIETMLEDVVDDTLNGMVREIKHLELEKALKQSFTHIQDYDPTDDKEQIQIIEYTPEIEEPKFSNKYDLDEKEASFWDIEKTMNFKESHH